MTRPVERKPQTRPVNPLPSPTGYFDQGIPKMTKSSGEKKARSGSTSSASGSPKPSKSGKTSAAGGPSTGSPTAGGGGGSSFASAATTSRALTPNRQLGELLSAVEPRFCFHPAVEELLLDMATEFVGDVVDFSGNLAKHRRSTVLEAKDLQLCLAKNYGISLAGVLPSRPEGGAGGAGGVAGAAGVGGALNPLGQDVVVRARPAKNSIHMHRLALKRKAILRARALKLKSTRAGRPEAAGKKLARKGSVSNLDAK